MSKLTTKKRIARNNRRARVRKKVLGTTEKPRLSVYRSLNHIYAQIIDDVTGQTLASASSLKLTLAPAPVPEPAEVEEGKEKKGKKDKKEKKAPSSTKMLRSIEVGKVIAERAKEKGIEKVVFDRNGFLYHGRVAALAESAREHGLKF
ncbi:MAG TPA: 50S ribosomal protein L18 [Candidatus Krumholzibacterium sp.]|nr:50S ribosomal protein L18 [Candidatus Krumholzibacterium sp.]